MGCEGRGSYNQLRELGNTLKRQELFELNFKDMKNLYMWEWSMNLSSRRTVFVVEMEEHPWPQRRRI